MKKILSTIVLLSFFLASCLKDSTINTKGGLISAGRSVEIQYSGLEYFSQKAVLTAGVTDPIIEPMVINIAAANGKAIEKDLTVTLAVDDAARVAYNAVADNTVKYDAMPDSCYSLTEKTGIIKAGQYLDTLSITFYPDKIDPTKNYMAAISLKDAQGEPISGNFSTVYYHTIGNPLAGNYTWDFYRWNNATGTGALQGSSFMGDVTTFLPDDPTTIEVASGYVGVHYVLTFTNTGGTLSDFSLDFSEKDKKDILEANGITVVNGPNILLADPVTGHYKFQYQVLNATPAPRYIVDEFYK
jgi:hypothetical protein